MREERGSGSVTHNSTTKKNYSNQLSSAKLNNLNPCNKMLIKGLMTLEIFVV
jgi:hypothetical protein